MDLYVLDITGLVRPLGPAPDLAFQETRPLWFINNAQERT